MSRLPDVTVAPVARTSSPDEVQPCSRREDEDRRPPPPSVRAPPLRVTAEPPDRATLPATRCIESARPRRSRRALRGRRRDRRPARARAIMPRRAPACADRAHADTFDIPARSARPPCSSRRWINEGVPDQFVFVGDPAWMPPRACSQSSVGHVVEDVVEQGATCTQRGVVQIGCVGHTELRHAAHPGDGGGPRRCDFPRPKKFGRPMSRSAVRLRPRGDSNSAVRSRLGRQEHERTTHHEQRSLRTCGSTTRPRRPPPTTPPSSRTRGSSASPPAPRARPCWSPSSWRGRRSSG